MGSAAYVIVLAWHHQRLDGQLRRRRRAMQGGGKTSAGMGSGQRGGNVVRRAGQWGGLAVGELPRIYQGCHQKGGAQRWISGAAFRPALLCNGRRGRRARGE